MSIARDSQTRVRPAQLNFLAIYSPSLNEDEKEEDSERKQIVFFYSRTVHAKQQRKGHGAKDGADQIEIKKEENEQLRQVGLAQGMLNFAGARGFSGGTPVDSIETEKHRLVLAELEKDWWVLASIDLTRLPTSRVSNPAPTTISKSKEASPQSRYEYSSREVSPPALLIQQLFHAYNVFLLHHDTSLSNLYVNLRTRERFCGVLERYWTQFALTWDVMLHGNPAVDMYNGIKLSAGGELGIGVGEEEWGSGEREVLEALIRNTEGLVDATVSRFGNAPPTEEEKGFSGKDTVGETSYDRSPWLGSHSAARPSDGFVFSGVDVISRASLRDMSTWIEDIYTYGEDAYGIRSNPSAATRKRRKRKPPSLKEEDSVESAPEHGKESEQIPSESAGNSLKEVGDRMKPQKSHPTKKGREEALSDGSPGPNIPPPILPAAEESLKEAIAAADSKDKGKDKTSTSEITEVKNPSGTWTKYLKLGYGTAWGASSGDVKDEQLKTETKGSSQPTNQDREASSARKDSIGAPSAKDFEPQTKVNTNPKPKLESISSRSRPHPAKGGYFLIGLRGDLDLSESSRFNSAADEEDDEDEADSWSGRLSVRSLWVTMQGSKTKTSSSSSSSSFESSGDPDIHLDLKRARLRVLIYAHQPFLYLLLFEESTPHLTISSFYHDLHHHLTPLHSPLLKSTDPHTIRSRISASLPRPNANSDPIFDLVYSPRNMTVRSSIPNIPVPGTLAAEGFPPSSDSTRSNALALEPSGWTRAEALSVHSRILDLISETRNRGGSLQFTGAGTLNTRETEGERGRGGGVEDSNPLYSEAQRPTYESADAYAGGRKGGYNLFVRPSERERTVKTSRGWWIVWLSVWTSNVKKMRGRSLGSNVENGDENDHAVEHDHVEEEATDDDYKEAFLIRRARDATSAGGRNGSSYFSSGKTGRSAGVVGTGAGGGGAGAGASSGLGMGFTMGMGMGMGWMDA